MMGADVVIGVIYLLFLAATVEVNASLVIITR